MDDDSNLDCGYEVIGRLWQQKRGVLQLTVEYECLMAKGKREGAVLL